jgi:hypothetical protein
MVKDLFFKQLPFVLQKPALAERTAASTEVIRTFKSDVTAYSDCR